VSTVSAGICPALDGLTPWLELGSAGKAGWAGGGAGKRRRAQRCGPDEAHGGGCVRSIGWDKEQLMTEMGEKARVQRSDQVRWDRWLDHEHVTAENRDRGAAQARLAGLSFWRW
jgi:hypothetical protein